MSCDDIPCELCNSNISYDNYLSHVEVCLIANRSSLEVIREERIQNEVGNDFVSFIANLSSNEVPPSFETIVTMLQIYFNQENNYEFNLHLQEISGGDVNIPVLNKEQTYDIITDNIDSEPITCSICLEIENKENKENKENIDTKEKVFVRTKCNHDFCKECIDRWFDIKSKCPICINDFNE
jgi:hypothetical protein